MLSREFVGISARRNEASYGPSDKNGNLGAVHRNPSRERGTPFTNLSCLLRRSTGLLIVAISISISISTSLILWPLARLGV